MSRIQRLKEGLAGERAVSRFLRLSRSNRRALAEALTRLIIASLAIKLLPFKRTVQLMDVRSRAGRPDLEEERRLMAQCRWAVSLWADRVPWRAVCFQRGLTLHLMLRRRGIPSILHYGVAQDPEVGLKAHVWVSVHDGIVIGGSEASQFTRVASFPADGQG